MSKVMAGCAVSPLLGALYLKPLDREMERLQRQSGIFYIRFMDDFVIMAPTRHKLKAALRSMYAVLDDLKLTIHPDKRFIGKTNRWWAIDRGIDLRTETAAYRWLACSLMFGGLRLRKKRRSR